MEALDGKEGVSQVAVRREPPGGASGLEMKDLSLSGEVGSERGETTLGELHVPVVTEPDSTPAPEALDDVITKVLTCIIACINESTPH